MSSMDKDQGPYEREMTIVSTDADDFIVQHGTNVLVMDIEGAERELLQHAKLPGIERVYLELHDHLYGLDGIRDITQALALKGYAYDPRGSRGPCVLFAKGQGARVSRRIWFSLFIFAWAVVRRICFEGPHLNVRDLSDKRGDDADA